MLVAQSCPPLCDPTNCSPPVSSIHEPLLNSQHFGKLTVKLFIVWLYLEFFLPQKMASKASQNFCCLLRDLVYQCTSRYIKICLSNLSNCSHHTHTHTHTHTRILIQLVQSATPEKSNSISALWSSTIPLSRCSPSSGTGARFKIPVSLRYATTLCHLSKSLHMLF